MVAESRFYTKVNAHRGAMAFSVTAPWVETLALSASQDSLVVLSASEGSSPQGLWLYTDNRWRLCVPQKELAFGAASASSVDVYYDQTVATVVEDSATLFKNGVLAPDHTITPGFGMVWATLSVANAGEGAVLSVNDVLPDGDGNVTLGIPEIPGLEQALLDAGKVKTVNSQGPDANGNVLIDIAAIPNLQALLDSKVRQVNAVLPINGVLTLTAIDIGALDVALRGAANGVASLDANGTVPISELPAAILGALRYQGAYDASNDTPPLPTPDATNIGFYWVVSVAGTQHGLTLEIGDWVVSNGIEFDKIDNQNTVSSVNGQMGVVLLGVADIPGAVASVNGALPDAQGAVVVPFATETAAGTVKIPADSGLVIAPDGALTLSPEVISNIGFTPIRVLYVALNGDPILGNGKVNNPFTTIGDAVVAATDGTAIVVRTPGNFAESVTINNKQIALLAEQGSAFNQPSVVIQGFLALSGGKPISLQDIGVAWGGTGAAFRATSVGAGGTSIRNLNINTSSAAQAVQIDASDGAWAGNMTIEGLSVNDGKIQIDAGNVSIRSMPYASNSIMEINGGSVELSNVQRLQRLDHTAGAAYLENVRQIGVSSAAPAINSSATAAAGNILSLRNVSTWASPTAQSYVNKTGACQYIVDGLSRNLASDVWNGTELAVKSRYDRDVIVTRAGVNYTGALGAYASAHYAGIDTALGLRLQTITSAGGTSLVQNGSAGQLRGLVAGTGVDVTAGTGTLTITNTGVTALSSVAGTSLVNTTAGQLKAVAAGAGMTITEAGGVLTFTSTAAAGVTTLNGASGALTLAVNGGLTIGTVGQTITLTPNLTSAGGTSLVNAANGVLKGVAAGANITITEAGGVLTFASSGGGGGGVTSFNGDVGDIMLQAGLGITITGSGGIYTVAALGGGSGIQSVSPSVGEGLSLVQDDGTTTAIAVIKRLIAGTGVTLTESATGITLDASEGGVTSVNEQTGAVEITGGTDIAVTIDELGRVSIAYTGSAAGTKVDSINGMTGPLTMSSTSSNLTILSELGELKFTVQGFLTGVENATTANPAAVPLVANTGMLSGVAVVKQIVAGANIQVTADEGTLTLDVTGGSGTVKSVNNITPADLETGNVTLEAGDVGALPIVGGGMEGDIDMASNAIKNLPNPVDGGDPITLAFFSSGDLIIDNGEI